MDLDNVSELCDNLEMFLEKVKDSKISIKRTNEFINLMFESLEVLRSVVKSAKKENILDIDNKLLTKLKSNLHDFENENESNFITPISPEKLESLLSDNTNIFYKMVINLQESCKFKKVRLYVIFRALNRFGQICWSNPEPNSLENSKFDLSFEIFFVSRKNKDEIMHTLDEIMEIDSKIITKLSSQEFKRDVKEACLKWEEIKKSSISRDLTSEKPGNKETILSLEDPIEKYNFPKIIFTNTLDFTNNKNIIFLPNNNLVDLIINDKVNVIFSCNKRLNRSQHYLYVVKEGFCFVSENDDFKSFEDLYKVQEHNFTNFNEFLEALKYSISNYEAYLIFKESQTYK